jgi:glycosyltransferase involved in cell wall biosynthesis
MRSRIASAGIEWIPLRYHKTPSALATSYDIVIGTIVALYQTLRHRVAVIHSRSYVAALMALVVKRLSGRKLLFDMRGFWADERVDCGLWPANGRLYRAAKTLERHFLEAADHVVTLTRASAAEIARFPYLQERLPPITIIPTCVDVDRFRPSSRPAGGPFVLGHVGAVGTSYLFDETLAFFKLLSERRPDARLLVVNRDEWPFIQARIEALGVDPDKTEIVSADPSDVPALIGRMTVGAAIIKPLYSKMASAPTKLAEYLACGIPCLGNRGVGDLEEILERERVGVIIRSLSDDEMGSAADRLLDLIKDEGLADRCTEAARRLFSLDQGVEDYRAIYRRLTASA